MSVESEHLNKPFTNKRKVYQKEIIKILKNSSKGEVRKNFIQKDDCSTNKKGIE